MIGDIIKKIRIEKGLTSKQLAELTNLTPAYLSMLENGKRTNPSTEIIQSIANALNVPMGYFFEKTTSENKPEIQVPKEYSSKYKVTSRDKKQYLEEIKKANEAFFMDDEFNEDAKKEMLDLMSELFWEAKAMNKRKK